MGELGTPLAQLLAAAVACAVLYSLWIRFEREGIGIRLVAIGFAGRALLSAALFWISWLRLPIARSLQLGGGLWFFGLDGKGYYLAADEWIARGTSTVLTGDHSNPSHLYVQALAISKVLFGSPVSVALLINLFAFLGGALLIVRWGRRSGNVKMTRMALVGWCLTPSFVLWATQPLKDNVFMLGVVAFVYGQAGWIEMDRGGTRRAIGAALIMVLALYVVSGVRWYYAVILWMIFLPVAGVTGLTVRPRKLELAVGSIGLFGLLSIPLMTNHYASFPGSLYALFRIPSWLFASLQQSKVLFETDFRGATLIGPGPLIDSLPFADVVARGVLVFLPRLVASALGLAGAGGGRGLWAFAELDTLFVLGFSVCMVVSIWKSRPRGWLHEPLVIFLAALFLGSLPMLYAINNFGTLFRFREMLFLPVILLPLTVSGSSGAPESSG